MSFRPLNNAEMADIKLKLEAVTSSLNKSFSAGVPGAANAERTGLASFATDDVSPIMESIALKHEQLMITKDIKTLQAKQTLYQYVVKTAVGTTTDLFGTENFMPGEDASQYVRTAEVLKVMGCRKSMTHQAAVVNQLGGYSIDIEKENDENAMLQLAESLERACYHGGDGYIDTSGSIDSVIAANYNGPIRQIRGMQAQIREGNNDQRGIPLDFIGYANSRQTVIDAAGSVLTRNLLDDICTAAAGNNGVLVEAHVTPEQVKLFRASLFPVDRGMLGDSYAIRGSNITNEHKSGFPIETTSGSMLIRSTIFKYEKIYCVPVNSSVQFAPLAPSATPTQTAGNTSFKAGDVVKYTVQSCNQYGRSAASTEISVTIAADGNNVVLSITPTANNQVEFYRVHRLNPGDVVKPITGTAGLGTVYNHKFIGNVAANRQGSTLFVDSQAILPGLNAIVFLPREQYRAELAVLGDRVSRIQFGIRGLAQEYGYVSYLALVLKHPRQFGLMQNVFEEFKS
jgi:hypothetical protein